MNLTLDLGDARIDEQHVRLEVLIAKLASSAPADALGDLDALMSHAAAHFAEEDEVLRAMSDGNAKCHLDEHAAVLRSLHEVRSVLCAPGSGADGGTDSAGKTALKDRLAGQLLQWLPEHVHAMDAGVVTYRSKQRFGGQPVKLTRTVR